jgi:hypothetical protein
LFSLRIQTARLTLRVPTDEDFPSYSAPFRAASRISRPRSTRFCEPAKPDRGSVSPDRARVTAPRCVERCFTSRSNTSRPRRSQRGVRRQRCVEPCLDSCGLRTQWRYAQRATREGRPEPAVLDHARALAGGSWTKLDYGQWLRELPVHVWPRRRQRD